MVESDWAKVGFQTLVGMSPEYWDVFAEMLESSFDESKRGSELPNVGLEPRELMSFIQFVLSIPNRFDSAEDIVDAASTVLDEAALPLLYERLERVLGTEIVAVSKKRRFLAQHHERFFLSAKITTDLRAVFGEQTFRPLDWIVNHVLCIKFSQSDDSKEIFFALETSDLAVLQKELERAVQKEEILVKHIQPGKARLKKARTQP